MEYWIIRWSLCSAGPSGPREARPDDRLRPDPSADDDERVLLVFLSLVLMTSTFSRKREEEPAVVPLVLLPQPEFFDQPLLLGNLLHGEGMIIRRAEIRRFLVELRHRRDV